MPTYSYRCAACGHDFDQYQSFTDASLTVCPSCAKPELRKVFSNIGVTFNGSGFYRTDSRAESGAKETKSTIPAGSAPAKKAEAPSTPTPAAAPSTTSTSSS